MKETKKKNLLEGKLKRVFVEERKFVVVL